MRQPRVSDLSVASTECGIRRHSAVVVVPRVRLLRGLSICPESRGAVGLFLFRRRSPVGDILLGRQALGFDILSCINALRSGIFCRSGLESGLLLGSSEPKVFGVLYPAGRFRAGRDARLGGRCRCVGTGLPRHARVKRTHPERSDARRVIAPHGIFEVTLRDLRCVASRAIDDVVFLLRRHLVLRVEVGTQPKIIVPRDLVELRSGGTNFALKIAAVARTESQLAWVVGRPRVSLDSGLLVTREEIPPGFVGAYRAELIQPGNITALISSFQARNLPLLAFLIASVWPDVTLEYIRGFATNSVSSTRLVLIALILFG